MFKPDVPLIIMRRKDLTHQQKAFLLWCWICRDSDGRCDLISNAQDCNLRGRSITWYADFFGVTRQQMQRDIFGALRNLDVIKTRQNMSVEVVYVDFTIFNL